MKTYISKSANTILKEYFEKDLGASDARPKEGCDARSKEGCDAYSEKGLGKGLILVGPILNVDPAINCHPDIIYCKLKDDEVFVGDENYLSAKYPGDIRYNACSTGKYFIHNLKYTDEALLNRAKELGLKLIDVKQGYAKCSIVVVDEDSIITYDEGIVHECENVGLSVLQISPGNVRLDGYSTGFIGGTSGKVGNEIIFNGDLSLHPDFDRIKTFIEERGLILKYFPEYELTDIGSIIEVD